MAASSSDDDVSDSEWVFYRDRPEWKDVTLCPQDDGPFPVVRIAYSDKFKDVYDFFRAILKANERSERAFQLTADAATLNAANYTVWHYRRLLLKDLNKDLQDELRFISDMIEEHPKNYQVWHHRRVVIERAKDASKELEFTATVLRLDAKNYHAWQHRQWVLKEFSLWDKELEYVDHLLTQDLRNNSAWNQRYYVIDSTTEFTPEVIKREFDYVKKFISKAPNNESAWNYLRGIYLGQETTICPEIMEYCQGLFEERIRSPYLLGYMVELYEDLLEKKSTDTTDILTKATKLCTDLAENYDSIRKEYWNYISRSLQQKYQECGS